MATYNGQLYIEEQLSSILKQLNNNDEIIIVDDCSKDKTVSIIESLQESRIKLLKNDKNIGVVGNFYKGLCHATGDFIFLSDQDDVWESNKVEKTLKELVNYDLICHDCKVTDSNLNEIYPSYISYRNSGKGVLKNYLKNGYIGCCMAFKKEVFEVAKTNFLEVPMHDVWLGLIAELKGYKVKFMDEILVKYRRHEDVVSETGRKRQILPSIKSLTERITLLKLLTYSMIKK